MLSRQLRRIPRVRSLNDPKFESEIIAPIQTAVADGVCTTREASEVLLEAIAPWMEAVAKQEYTNRTRGGSSVGSDESATNSEVHMRVFSASLKIDWNTPAAKIRGYLQRTAGCAAMQGGRTDDDMDRRARVYLRKSRQAVDERSAELERDLTPDERRQTILWALEHKVPPSIRPSRKSFDVFADMIERCWSGARVNPTVSTDGGTLDLWDTVDDPSAAIEVVDLLDSARVTAGLLRWAEQHLPADTRDWFFEWVGQRNAGLTDNQKAIVAVGGTVTPTRQNKATAALTNDIPAKHLAALRRHSDSLLAILQQEHCEVADRLSAARCVKDKPKPKPKATRSATARRASR